MHTHWIADNDHSELSFRVKHLNLVYTTGKVEDFEVKLAAIDIQKEDWKFEMTADLNSLNSLNQIRDERVKAEDFLNVAAYPQMEFQTAALRPTAEKNRFDLHGTLSLKGIAKEVKLSAFFTGRAVDSYSGQTKMGWRIEGKIDRRNWGIDFNLPFEGEGVAIGNHVDIRAELEFKTIA